MKTMILRALPLVTLLSTLVLPAHGEDYIWNRTETGSSSWNIPTNWTPNGTPGAGDNIAGNVLGSTGINLPTGSTFTVNNFTMTNTGGGDGGLWSIISGNNGTATLRITGVLANTSSNQLFIQSSVGNAGFLALEVNQLDVTGGNYTLGAGANPLASLQVSSVNFNGSANVNVNSLTNYSLGLVSNNATGNSVLTLGNTVSEPTTRTIAVSGITGSGNGGNLTIRSGGAGGSAQAAVSNLVVNSGSNHTTTAVLTDGPAAGSSLSLVKQGSGTQTFSGASATTYSGTTHVQTGTLAFAGGRVLGTGNITIDSGATLNLSGRTAATYTLASGQALIGSGTVVIGAGKTLTVAGLVDPGAETGGLVFQGGTLTITDDASFSFTLGSANDLVALTDGANLNIGTGLLSFSDFAFTQGAGFGAGTYTLVTTEGGIVGTLGTASGSINGFDATLGISGNDLVVSVVPEPRAMALIIFGIAFVVLVARRRALSA